MGGYRDPFGGQRKAGSNKASRPKQFRKKKNDGANEDRRPSKKSPWALLGAVGSFAAVWVFTIFKVQSDSKQKTLFISEHDVEESLRNGKINARKSEPKLRPCAKYVVDAKVGKQQKRTETVFAACPANTKVVTVIDQDTNWECYCP